MADDWGAEEEEAGFDGEAEALADGQYPGVVKSYGPSKGYGFITSESIEGDIWFSDKSLPVELSGLEPSFFNIQGRQVLFVLSRAKDGKPQANEIQLYIDEGEHIVGQVKSFNTVKGFGFLTSSFKPDRDIYFQNKDVPVELQGTELVGRRVRLKVVTLPDGNVQARDMLFSSTFSSGGGSLPSGPAGKGGKAGCGGPIMAMKGPMAMKGMKAVDPWGMKGMDPMAMKGMKGKPGLDPYGGDPYGAYAGAGYAASPYGAASAYAAMMLKGKPSMMAKGPTSGKGVAPSVNPSLLQRKEPDPDMPVVGSHMEGLVKSFIAAKRMGKIDNVPGLPARQEVAFKLAPNEPEVDQGEKVNFILNWDGAGKPQATKVSRALAEGEAMVGTIKSFTTKTGYGFVTCEGYSRDVYFKTQDLPKQMQAEALAGNITGATVRFVVKLAMDGKPQVKELTLIEMPTPIVGIKRRALEDGGRAVKRLRTDVAEEEEAEEALAAEAEEDGVFRGFVKSYNPVKGWGFINSSEVEGDIWFRKMSLPPAARMETNLASSEVTFELVFAPDGKPQAQSIEVV